MIELSTCLAVIIYCCAIVSEPIFAVTIFPVLILIGVETVNFKHSHPDWD